MEDEPTPMDIDVHIFSLTNKELILSLHNEIGLNINKITHLMKLISDARKNKSNCLSIKLINNILNESEANKFYGTYYCHYVEEKLPYAHHANLFDYNSYSSNNNSFNNNLNNNSLDKNSLNSNKKSKFDLPDSLKTIGSTKLFDNKPIKIPISNKIFNINNNKSEDIKVNKK